MRILFFANLKDVTGRAQIEMLTCGLDAGSLRQHHLPGRGNRLAARSSGHSHALGANRGGVRAVSRLVF
jgi:molybdopterin converting factor small subunit